ncbi:MAG: hypothetical protein OZ929_23730 [Bryobacterales bacterium]|nr:hypothetical protein [Bryobacterales bacterium]
MKQESKTFEIEFHLKPAVRAVDRPAGEKPNGGSVRRRFDRYPRIVQVVALAIHFQDMLDRGEVRNHADLARLGCISRERMSQIMTLAWLAPDIRQEVLSLPKTPGGRFPVSESALRSIARVPKWEDQRARWELLPATVGTTAVDSNGPPKLA